MFTEYSAVSSYVDAAQLDAASKFVFHCRRLPRLQVRLECHEVCFTWPQAAQQLQEKLEVINKACNEFHESEPNLKQFLGLVLSVGNFLNGDTARGQVSSNACCNVYFLCVIQYFWLIITIRHMA